ncbi:30S ribosomal protein S8 [Patescibacteria group bacterium]|nr:30S ribosomal protein S8 [Patescibacteria group bacterium]MBU1703519.1 30S ribosomal protein S8 [Patescibacteria group bacterium]MBU1953426.1 30S ribosomal protein S8 [Patescibacteria group bacterium]
MITDPIADLLTRIRNAYHARKETLTVPHSVSKMAILKVMKDRKFVIDFREASDNKFKEIVVILNQARRDLTLKRISKPGQRIYIKGTDIRKINGGLGVSIISTSRGVISGEEAKKMNVGGELICEIF